VSPRLKALAPGARRPRESSSSTDRVQKGITRFWATPKGAITGWLTVGSRIDHGVNIGVAGAWIIVVFHHGWHSEEFILNPQAFPLVGA
jgi:hypothetical protein